MRNRRFEGESVCREERLLYFSLKIRFDVGLGPGEVRGKRDSEDKGGTAGFASLVAENRGDKHAGPFETDPHLIGR